jgi:2-polyprenyl-6-methoxyphenol hydroxylase-like FAD-dependent oxidoreductase
MPRIGEHAVVLGASMSGLLAARVLADFYRAVTVVERDALPTGVAQRRGVPQARHVHALWPRGSEILDDLFPGFAQELVAAGCPVNLDGDFSKSLASFGGHLFVRSGHMSNFRPGNEIYYPSRILLEGLVRRRVRTLANVTLLDGHDAVELTSTPDRTCITGLTATSRESDEKRTLTADLVVDCTGRGSRTPAFLERLGYDRPKEDEVVVRLVYTSQLLRIPAETLNELLVLVGPAPGRTTAMALFSYEDNTRMLTAVGLAGREPPAEFDGMLRYIEEFTPPHVMSALRCAEPLGEVARYGTPSSRWRRYDKMPRFPHGFLVFGDAICSFNPLYGQGMTVAALQALALDRCLRGGAKDLAPRYFRAASKPVGVAWQLAVGGDLSLPEVQGHRPLSMRLVNRYVERLQAAAETDTVTATRFMRVAGFRDAPATLMRPSVVLRVARTNLRQRRAQSARTRPEADLSSALSAESQR